MIQLNEIFLIGEQKCKVGHDGDHCFWVRFLKEDGRNELEHYDREAFFKQEFEHRYMHDIICKDSGKLANLKIINYRDDSHTDSPDFYNLEDLTQFVEELRKIVFFNHFHELILN